MPRLRGVPFKSVLVSARCPARVFASFTPISVLNPWLGGLEII